MRGRFIVLEGGEGCGKTSVQGALGEAFARAHIDCLLTREPGGTELGEQVRRILLAHRAVSDPLAELLLFEAARAHLVSTVIRPGLEHHAVVLCDRFTASSVAYQGYGRGLGRELVERANAIATGGLEPDLVLLLDLPVALGLARRAGDGATNHFDQEAVAFHERVRAGFLELAHDDPDRWRIIDAAQPLHDVIEQAWQAAIAR